MYRSRRTLLVYLLPISLYGATCLAQQAPGTPTADEEKKMLLERIEKLEQRLATLESKQGGTAAPAATPPIAQSNVVPQASVAHGSGSVSASDQQNVSAAAGKQPLSFSDGTTLNFDFDGYYGYNFNHPIGRVNLLRANDVLANNFTLNQIGVIVERAPDLQANRRFGFRADLMFGENTETMQGGAQNEPRPQVYRNIFQAYGSYVFPVGHGLQVDFGKFASSIGYEGNYVKDQFNYSRSYYFNFLPFYHMGLRATYNLNSKLSLQYWLVNGANQTETFNGFKSQAAVLIFKPNSKISWNVNYYVGQEQRDVVPDLNPGLPTLPTQPGLSVTPVDTRHDGRLHIIDSYASFAFSPKWTAVLEGDYVINRVAANSAPTRVYGGVGYLHRQITDAFALNARFSYLKDQGGLFSGMTQDLKEITATAVYQFADGFQTRLEYRRDFSNRAFFLTNDLLSPARSQDTATLGMVWWFGGKQGSW